MDYQNLENYFQSQSKASDKLTTQFGFPLKVRFYENRMIAVYDLCFGLHSFLSHRPKVGFVRQGSRLADVILPQLYRQQSPVKFKEKNESLADFVKQLDHEMNFVLWTAKNEITLEESLTLAEKKELHQLLSAKRLFSIEIVESVTEQNLQDLKTNTYSVIIETGSIFNLQPVRIFHTDKLKTLPLISQCQNLFNTPIIFDELIIKTDENKEFLDLKEFDQITLKVTQNQDRLLINSKLIAGLALKQKLKLSSVQGFAPAELQIPILESFAAWWPEAADQDYIRGLLVINLNQVNVSQILDQIKLAHQDLTAQSSWSMN